MNTIVNVLHTKHNAVNNLRKHSCCNDVCASVLCTLGAQVPILWDKELKTIVNNESSEIIVMLNDEFNAWAKHPEVDLNPKDLREEMDELNEWTSRGWIAF